VRADQALVARGLATSRSAAARLIGDGAVFVLAGGLRVPVTRAAASIAPSQTLQVAESDETRFVSRAGAKLARALDHTGLVATGKVVLDIGISTGGFADCLLAAGAAKVGGVDVGHGELHPRLAADPRVALFEGVNARQLDRSMLGDAMPARGFDLLVADVSFISLTKLLPAVLPLAAIDGVALMLVKPQFELDADALDRRGVVRDPALYLDVERNLRDTTTMLGWRLVDWFDSALPGGDGNREFFMECRP
jgi:23S rRNA (cytidine1920-2'-O)/16S rRNA (cytidine1409-2'-O)-methyltransferase